MRRYLLVLTTILLATTLVVGCSFILGPDDTGDQTPDGDTSGDDTSGDDTTGDDTSGDDTTGDDTTGDDTTGDDTTGDDTTGDDTTGDDTTGDGEETIEEIARVTPEPFTYPAYSIAQLATVPELIGEAYLVYTDDPSDPNSPHREKPLTMYYTEELEELKEAFRTAWYYYANEVGENPGDAMPPDVNGVQADGLVHIWNWSWIVQNLSGGDNELGDPWNMGLSAMLAAPLVTPDRTDPDNDNFPPQVFVVTGEALLDWDRGINQTGEPLENVGNTQANVQIFANGLYEITTPGEPATWKKWIAE